MNRRYMDEMFEEVEIVSDIPYMEAVIPGGQTQKLYLDIYAPSGDVEKKRRVIFLVHGGGFRGCDKTQAYVVDLAKRLAKCGYVAVLPGYTLFRKYEPSYSLEKCAELVAGQCEQARQFILENAEKYGIDPKAMALGGGSAGGMTCCFWCRQPGAFAAFLDMWGSLDNIEDVEGFIPTFIVHGTKDQSVDYENSVRLKSMLDDAGIRCELFTLEGEGHTPAHRINEYLPLITDFLQECF